MYINKTLFLLNPLYSTIYFSITPKNKGDEEKVSVTLNKIVEEDPTIQWYRNSETKQALVGGQGELHINVVKDKMKEKFGVDVNLEDLKVAYRETIKGKADVQGKHKKQSGGHGQYGDVKIILGTVIAVLKRDGISSETSATMEAFCGTPAEDMEKV